jgi:hypothetical protein
MTCDMHCRHCTPKHTHTPRHTTTHITMHMQHSTHHKHTAQHHQHTHAHSRHAHHTIFWSIGRSTHINTSPPSHSHTHTHTRIHPPLLFFLASAHPSRARRGCARRNPRGSHHIGAVSRHVASRVDCGTCDASDKQTGGAVAVRDGIWSGLLAQPRHAARQRALAQRSRCPRGKAQAG